MAIETYLSEEKIKQRLEELGEEISRDYDGEELEVIGILNGSFMFCSDLVRKIKVPMRIDFMSVSSYGDGMTGQGKLKIELDLRKDISGKHVLIVEDIVDTGLTMKELNLNLKNRGAKSVRLACLLLKPEGLKHEVKIDYLGFEIEDHFVIGYGLDYGGRYRELPFIGIYSND